MKLSLSFIVVLLSALVGCSKPVSKGTAACDDGTVVADDSGTVCVLGLTQARGGNPHEGVMITETGALPIPFWVASPVTPEQAAEQCDATGKPFAHRVWETVVCSAQESLSDDAKHQVLLLAFSQAESSEEADPLTAADLEAWAEACSAFCAESACTALVDLDDQTCEDACLYGVFDTALDHGLACASAASAATECLADAACEAGVCGIGALIASCPFASDGTPGIAVSPEAVTLEGIQIGTTVEQAVTLSNTGDGPLAVSSLALVGAASWSATFENGTLSAGDHLALEPPFLLVPGAVATITVQYAPEVAESTTATLSVGSNAPDTPTVEVALSGTASDLGEPCLSVQPEALDFEQMEIGSEVWQTVTVSSCSEAALTVKDIELTEGTSTAFELSTPDDLPLALETGDSLTFDVTFAPDEPGEHAGAVKIVLDGAGAGDATIALSGIGATEIGPDDPEPPTATIAIAEGSQVIPQTNIHLFGDESFSGNGEIVSYLWPVQQPNGSASVFLPSANAPQVTFEANVVGLYVFSLTVTDELGLQASATEEVLVVTNEAIHVELTWTTPGDPDETDEGPEAGTDLDLHFLHSLAVPVEGSIDTNGDGEPDPWFDQPFDCFWFNAHPNWGSFDPEVDDDPGLDRDDTDGAGPENLNLAEPADTTYRVGVHYWSDHGYGTSFATVRIYIWSELALEISGVEMESLQFWDVAEIDWTTGEVTAVTDENGAPAVVDYGNPMASP